jgi:hypothetical protein
MDREGPSSAASEHGVAHTRSPSFTWCFFHGKKRWVKTYELTEIKLAKAWGADKLELKDADGREVWIKITDIQDNPACGTWSTTASCTRCITAAPRSTNELGYGCTSTPTPG